MPHTLLRACLLVSTIALGSASARAAAIDAIEFHHAALDHYFITASADEIAKLDTGVHAGWRRTGLSFKVLEPTTATPGASPVCRFYGRPEAGLDSHFYSASVDECNDVKRKFAASWQLEADNVFLMYLPDLQTGVCPANTTPVYRSWNQRADSNHRYTTDRAVHQSMLARGYRSEGYGAAPFEVAMCAPGGTGGGGSAAPVCTLSANATSPIAGNAIVLTANCSNSPQRYTWGGCSGTGATCQTTSSAPGFLSYSVIATNPFGDSERATITIAWQSPPPPPQCSIVTTTSSDPPIAGTLAMLNASCTNAPTAFTWTGCVSETNTCYDRGAPGGRSYSVVAANAGGSGPPASTALGWQTTAPAPIGMCGSFPSVLITDAGVPSVVRVNTAAYSDPPGFAWNGVWTVKFTVPITASSSQIGHLTVAEFLGPPTPREATLSRVACDFRPTDPSGNNGPLQRAFGNSASAYFSFGTNQFGYPTLVPGGTYYFNVRNWQQETSSISCSSSGPARCDAFVDIVMPR